MIGIICPSSFEYNVLEASNLDKRLAVLICSGMGKVRAATACHLLMKNSGIDQLLMVGFAGALSSDLQIGDRIEPKTYIEYDYCAEPFEIYPNVISRSEVALFSDSKHPVMLTQDRFLTSNPYKGSELESEYPSVACDMESYALIHFCQATGIQGRVVKIISDVADASADHDFLNNCKKLAPFFNDTVQSTIRYLSR